MRMFTCNWMFPAACLKGCVLVSVCKTIHTSFSFPAVWLIRCNHQPLALLGNTRQKGSPLKNTKNQLLSVEEEFTGTETGCCPRRWKSGIHSRLMDSFPCNNFSHWSFPFTVTWYCTERLYIMRPNWRQQSWWVRQTCFSAVYFFPFNILCVTGKYELNVDRWITVMIKTFHFWIILINSTGSCCLQMATPRNDSLSRTVPWPGFIKQTVGFNVECVSLVIFLLLGIHALPIW